MIRKLALASILALALPATAQVVPAINYSDLWDNSATFNPATGTGGESGWGITFTQHAGSNQVLAIWYSYDPRAADPASPGNFKPLWIVMPGGTWTSPTSITGAAYVTLGTPFSQPWAFNSTTNPLPVTQVGTFTFTFTSNSTGTFHYNVAPPTGLASTDPAFGLPSFSGTRPISRNNFQ
jgi:hypothetical protein